MTLILRLILGRSLPSILDAGGLWSINHQPADLGIWHSIAHQNIQDRRARRRVPCGPGGFLHDYVPFYFGERSPMLCANYHRQVASNPDGQRPFIYLVSSLEAVNAAGLQWIFTDGHAVEGVTRFFDRIDDLTNVDMSAVHARNWAPTRDDPDRKRRKQAEFLVYRFFPWNLVAEIVVIDRAVKTRVETRLSEASRQVEVRICRRWYY